MVSPDTTNAEPNHGLYLQNSETYIGDLARPESLVEYAVAAEEAGWDGVFMSDGLHPAVKSIDPWITLSGIATRTNRIQLGTWVTPVPRRSPWQIAQNLVTLDHLSDGRVIFGAGLGNRENYTTYGREWNPRQLARHYDEALEVIAGLWGSEPFSYDGDHYTVNAGELHHRPVQQPRIPTILGCWWPNKKPFKRAAQWDGIMPWAAAFVGKEGLQGEPVTGTPEETVRDIVEYYRGLTDDPGEIVLPIDPPAATNDFKETCKALNPTWLLTTDLLEPDSDASNLERICEGPPK